MDRALNIKTKITILANDDGTSLYRSAKSNYVIARLCLELQPFDFLIPGFLLIQQSVENFIKAILKQKNISWSTGPNGHNLPLLVSLGDRNNIAVFRNINSRSDFMDLLKDLSDGYNLQRYGESGHFVVNHEKMMDLFDELVCIFLEEFANTWRVSDPNINQEEFERFIALPIPESLEKIFCRKLKNKKFIFCILPDPDNI